MAEMKNGDGDEVKQLFKCLQVIRGDFVSNLSLLSMQ